MVTRVMSCHDILQGMTEEDKLLALKLRPCCTPAPNYRKTGKRLLYYQRISD